MTYELLEYFDIDYVPLSNPRKGLLGALLELITKTTKICILDNRYNFSIAFGTSPSIAFLTRLGGVISVNFNEDDDDVVPLYTSITFPFTTKIINPEVIRYKKWKKKRVLYPSYQELAYLHPNHFKPDASVLRKYNLKKRRYVVVRFSALKAYHDIGKKGISDNLWNRIQGLCNGYKIITSRENERSHHIDPWDMHDIIAFAKMIISDSQTMTAEAAVLGVPSVRYNSFVGRISYLEELEHKYKLTYGFRPGQDDKMINTISKLLCYKNIHKEWQHRRKKMLSEKVDFNKWMINYFEKNISLSKNKLSSSYSDSKSYYANIR
jgi:predicted glycosyltransferase|tara:strand:+ start:1989 stop:2954 length:966 start_codon:yes stop_codon:yes gene_type:complete